MNIDEKTEPRVALIIDDEKVWSSILERLLSKLGFVARIACDAAEARIELAAREFDVILVDLQLPGQEGIGLVDEIRHNETLSSRSIIVTSYGGIARFLAGSIPVVDKCSLRDLGEAIAIVESRLSSGREITES